MFTLFLGDILKRDEVRFLFGFDGGCRMMNAIEKLKKFRSN